MSGEIGQFRYDATLAGEIEARWQQRWASEGTFWSAEPGGTAVGGIRAGGRAAASATCSTCSPIRAASACTSGTRSATSRPTCSPGIQRMTGRHVLHAYGYDAFGLPAEQYAIDTGQHPRVTTEANIAVMRGQLRRLGLGHDTRREFATTDPRLLPLDAVDLHAGSSAAGATSGPGGPGPSPS